MPRPTLIGLVGEKEVGKDTVGAMLTADYGYERRAFADTLRNEVSDCLNGEFPRVEPLVIPDDIKHVLAVYRSHGEAAFEKPVPTDMRRLLQWWGTEFRRTFDPEYWVKAVAKDLPTSTVITDVRFPNEVAFVRAAGGALIKINRSKPDSTIGPAVIETHVSEDLAKSDSVEYDLVIDNNGTLADLQAIIDKAFGVAPAPVEPIVPAPVEPPPTQSKQTNETPVPEPVNEAPVIEVPVPHSHLTDSAQSEGLVSPLAP